MTSVVGNISDTNQSKLVLSIKSCFKSYTSVIRWNASVIKMGSVCVSRLLKEELACAIDKRFHTIDIVIIM